MLIIVTVGMLCDVVLATSRGYRATIACALYFVVRTYREQTVCDYVLLVTAAVGMTLALMRAVRTRADRTNYNSLMWMKSLAAFLILYTQKYHTLLLVGSIVFIEFDPAGGLFYTLVGITISAWYSPTIQPDELVSAALLCMA